MGIVLLKLVAIPGCAKVHNETSHGLEARRSCCFINGMHLAKADDTYGRVLKMLFLIMKPMIPEVAKCFSYLKEMEKT